MQFQEDILLADIGNSRTKFSYNGSHYSYYNNYLEFDDIHEFIFKLKHKLKNFVYSSVNKKIECVLVDIMDELKINHTRAEDLLAKHKKIDFSGIEGMGADRKLGIIGALKFSEPPFITVDCGTSITINPVKDNKSLGGAIFPDVEMQLKTLHQLTDALPKVTITDYIVKSGTNTEDAIRYGVLGSVAGGIIYILDDLIRNNFNGQPPTIFMTGGLADKISDLIAADYGDVIIDEHLVLKGIENLVQTHIIP